MGCGSAKLCPEESLLASDCVVTGFEEANVEKIVRVIRTHSSAKVILRSQLEAIKTLLQLDGRNPELEQFFARLTFVFPNLSARLQAVCPNMPKEEVGSGRLLREDWMLVAGILLSSSSALDKAAALYFAFDEGFHNSMARETAEELLILMFRLAIEDFPLLSRNRDNGDVQKYLTKAQRNSQRAVKAALKLVMHEAPFVTMEEFANRLTACKEGDLTTACGLRSFANSRVRMKKDEGQPADIRKEQ